MGYKIGFAQRASTIILEELNLYFVDNFEDYINWYYENREFLKSEYLVRISKNLSISDFFGDWFKIRGKSFAGYFLGYEFIKYLESNYNLHEIAILPMDKIKIHLSKFLSNVKENFLKY